MDEQVTIVEAIELPGTDILLEAGDVINIRSCRHKLQEDPDIDARFYQAIIDHITANLGRDNSAFTIGHRLALMLMRGIENYKDMGGRIDETELMSGFMNFYGMSEYEKRASII